MPTQSNFDKFGSDTQALLLRAQELAEQRNHGTIGTEHLLLGLLTLPAETTARQMLLSFGCIPVINKNSATFVHAMIEVRRFVLQNNLAKKGDKVVVAAGAPFNQKNVETNLMLVETV